jgi:hypothetical protein
MNELETLVQHRKAILLAEVGAWLHLIWKCPWGFVEEQSAERPSRYSRNDFIRGLEPYEELSKLLAYDSTAFKSFLSALPITVPAGLGAFIRRRKEEEDVLTALMREAHGRASHIDKEDVLNAGRKQRLSETRRATAFGHEKEKLKPSDYNHNKDMLCAALEEYAGKLIDHLKGADVVQWSDYRRGLRDLIGKFGGEVLAETRVPFHDVTVFDQTSSAVAFFKAELARGLVELSGKANIGEEAPSVHAWRSLSVAVDGLEYLGTTRGIGDLLGRKRRLRAAQDAVARVLEVEFPMGTEIYRDEHQVVFIVPDAEDLLKWSDEGNRTLGERIEGAFVEATDGELRPDLDGSLLKTATRTVYLVAKQLSAPPDANCADPDSIRKSWPKDTRAELCSNCLLRPQIKAETRQLCRSCLDSRARRASEWWNEGAQGTIWIDEAADEN